jgi:hypothetical protein
MPKLRETKTPKPARKTARKPAKPTGPRRLATKAAASRPSKGRSPATPVRADCGALRALELGEGQQHIKGQATHRGRRVELLRDRHERDAFRVEDLDDLREVGQAIDLVSHHSIDLAGLDVGEKLLQGRAVQRRARQPAIVISLGETDPAFVPLALDEGFASLPLGSLAAS